MGYILRIVIAVFFALVFDQFSFAEVQPPIEAYGEQPDIRSVSISPDGSKILYITEKDDLRLLVAHSIEQNGEEPFMLDVSNVKANYAYFATNDIAVLRASKTTRIQGFASRIEYGAAFSVDLNNGDTVQLLSKDDDVYPGQGGIGRIIAIDPVSRSAYMPAYSGSRGQQNPRYSLFVAKFGRKTGQVFSRGVSATKDWLVSDGGSVLAREDFDGGKKLYRIKTQQTGKWETVFEDKDADVPPFWIVGVKSDESALIVSRQFDENEGEALFELGFDGTVGDEFFHIPGREIDSVLSDRGRKVYGVKYSGMTPSYAFFDSDIDAAVRELLNKYPDLNFSITSWSSDWSKVVLAVSGGRYKGDYLLFDTATGMLSLIADPRTSIPAAAIGSVQSVKYKARDGLVIQAILTWPPGRHGDQNLPAIILPHGGPHAYDQMGFDWMAQFFANRGYLVMQPNFRGSSGFGADFKERGYGEWGGSMQNDLTDGVNALIKNKFADPSRICIAGASYGGYAALAGGAYTPELYKCVIAISPISDLNQHGQSISMKYGRDSESYRSWRRTMGRLMDDKALMKSKSPRYSAEAFQAPVLLIHGRDDTVVKKSQSEFMKRALEQADKDASYVSQKGADHWMTDSGTRLETLQTMDEFLKAHNPID